MELKWPSLELLPGYAAALRRGWSPDNVRLDEAVREEQAAIAADPAAFVASLVDTEARGARIPLPDGSTVARIPGVHWWMWDGEFCGSIGFRWQPGTNELPPHCLGHVGFAVVPWKRRRGCATQALRLMLPYAREQGLDYIELTTDADNEPSQRVILGCGGRFVLEFEKPAQYGGGPGYLYRIDLNADT